MRRRLLLPAALLILGFLLTGCFEIEEKVVLAPTGEGSIRLLVRIPIAAKKEAPEDDSAKKTAEELSQELSGFTSVDMRSDSRMGQTVVVVEAKAPSFSKLASFYGPLLKEKKGNKASELGGVLTPKSFFTIKRKGNRLLITRTFTPQPKKKKKGDKDDKDLAMLMGLMGSSFMRFELVVPGTVISSNAEEADGSRLTWVAPMEYLQNNKAVFQAEVELSPEAANAHF